MKRDVGVQGGGRIMVRFVPKRKGYRKSIPSYSLAKLSRRLHPAGRSAYRPCSRTALTDARALDNL